MPEDFYDFDRSDPVNHLASIMTAMLHAKYRVCDNDDPDEVTDERFEEAKDAAMWTIRAMHQLGYRLSLHPELGQFVEAN